MRVRATVHRSVQLATPQALARQRLELDALVAGAVYTDALRAAIEAKVQGKEIVTPEAPKRPRVASLMQALEASLKEGRPPLSKVGSRKRQRAGRPAARRRAA